MITIHSKEGCPKCRVLKMKMEKKGIEYSENKDMEVMEKLGIKSLPVMEIDGTLLTFEKAIQYVNER